MAGAPAVDTDILRTRRRLRAKERRRWLVRAVVLINLMILGTVAVRGRPAGGTYYGGSDDLATTLGQGLGVGLTVFLTIATIGYVFNRAGGGIRTRWAEVAFGKPVLIVTFVLLFLGAGSRVARHQEALLQATPNPNGTPIQREKAHADATAWIKEFEGAGKEQLAALHDISAATSAIKKGNVTRALAFNRSAWRHFDDALGEARNASLYPEQDLNVARTTMIALVTLRRRAAGLYVAALEQNLQRGIPLTEDAKAIAMLDQGDRLINRSRKRGSRLIDRLSARYSIP